MLKSFGKSLLVIAAIMVATAVYTLVTTAIGQALFPSQANGSLISSGRVTQGATLIAQPFTSKKYLWGRQMAITTGGLSPKTRGTDVMYSGPSQLSPNGHVEQDLVRDRVKTIKKLNPDRSGQPVPMDLVTNSGSGLDPEISPKAAAYQVPRIAAARKLRQSTVQRIIDRNTRQRTLGILGEARVNVLQVNLSLDRLAHSR